MCLVESFGRSRMGDELLWRADWPGHQVAAAVWTGVVKPVRRTIGAECAFIGTDHCVGRRRRQVLVATFAVWFQCQHGVGSSS